MKDFKVGDAVNGVDSSSIYVVREAYGLKLTLCNIHSHLFPFNAGELQYAITVPDWIIKWREENMPPPTPVDTAEPPANTEETKTVRILARENARLAADLTTTQSALSLTERDNLNLREEARNDCDNIELMQATIDELREETDAHIRRYTYAERDLRLATTTRDASIQTAGMQLEELHKWRKDYAAVASVNIELSEALRLVREELAAEKSFNVNDSVLHLGARCATLQLKLDDIQSIIAREDTPC